MKKIVLIIDDSPMVLAVTQRARCEAQIEGYVSKRAGIGELVRHVREVIGP